MAFAVSFDVDFEDSQFRSIITIYRITVVLFEPLIVIVISAVNVVVIVVSLIC